MGCASSKQSKCQHCEAPYTPMVSRRSFSMNVHHPPLKKGDSYHVVALTSSTLESIKIDSPRDQDCNKKEKSSATESERNVDKSEDYEECVEKYKDFEMGMIEAKAWSKMIDEKITRVVPRTPIRTPPGEPETINVDDLMEGLDDGSPLRFGPCHGDHVRSFSFHVSADSIPPLIDSPSTEGFQQNVKVSTKDTKTVCDGAEKDDIFCIENSKSKDLVSDFDPEVISAFRKALEELSPTNTFGDQQQVIKEVVSQVENDKFNVDLDEKKNNNGYYMDEKMLNAHVNGFVDRIIAEEKDDSLSLSDDGYAHSYDEENGDVKVISSTKERVILYFTSLRGVRPTYENCCYVRLVLKGLGVRVDERDVSMDSGFKEELRELLGDNGFKDGFPKVFIGERYIGGIDEIRKMHEDGELEKVVQHCERLDDYGGNLVEVCEACGDIRFVPCETCSGSCKIYYEYEEDEEEEEEYEEDEYGFQRCPDCNENGLIRCPICCY